MTSSITLKHTLLCLEILLEQQLSDLSFCCNYIEVTTVLRTLDSDTLFNELEAAIVAKTTVNDISFATTLVLLLILSQRV